MLRRLYLIGSAIVALVPVSAHAHSVPQIHFLETANPYAPYAFLIGDWYSHLPNQQLAIHQQFRWGPAKSYISYATYMVLPGKPEQLHYEGMMVWNGQSKALDFLFALQPGSGAQEKGTLSVQADGTVVREIAMTAPDGDIDRFRQTFRKTAAGEVATTMAEQTATGWKLDPPGAILMERAATNARP